MCSARENVLKVPRERERDESFESIKRERERNDVKFDADDPSFPTTFR